VSRPGRTLPSGRRPPVTTVQESGWAPEPVWTQSLEEKSFRLCRVSNLDRLVVQSIGRHYTVLPEYTTQNPRRVNFIYSVRNLNLTTVIHLLSVLEMQPLVCNKSLVLRANTPCVSVSCLSGNTVSVIDFFLIWIRNYSELVQGVVTK
jgi:hypothetical protein